MKITHDGHVHTPYCPHGSDSALHAYIETAITHGVKSMTFAEHAPLPQSFQDPVPTKDSALPPEQLEDYMRAVQTVKKQYATDITIYLGLEVDYLEGFEHETKHFLNQVGPELDDSILSVHFIKHKQGWTCLDYSPDALNELVTITGSMEEATKKYYGTVLQSITAEMGSFKPRRIGHLTLIRKFQHQIPVPEEIETPFLTDIFKRMAEEKLQLDYNGAGILKPDCKETYPPANWAKKAEQLGIELVYGSDAHHPNGLFGGIDRLANVRINSPNANS
ncbi:histidinol-phosphatase HisJ [Salsuginibacillus kocurii]|uniref:histidinol-phosphatase HisJ n=1 Tax=Salsuginibacillus kocurii TaxID=427078 RepID=UPI0003699EA1|nr:histidinol-phosphatase HisJ [Salsuginibacillus kocurii]